MFRFKKQLSSQLTLLQISFFFNNLVVTLCKIPPPLNPPLIKLKRSYLYQSKAFKIKNLFKNRKNLNLA